MGSTYSVEKIATVMEHEGVRYYTLFERTVESNVKPRIPRVYAVTFGTATACMETIIRRATDCEGGMLKGKTGSYITPSAYIKQWRKALSQPSLSGGDGMTRDVGIGNGIYDLPVERREQIEALLEQYGHQGLVDGRLCFNYKENPLLLVDLCKLPLVGAWQLLDFRRGLLTPAPELGYSPEATKTTVPQKIDRIFSYEDEGGFGKSFWVWKESGAWAVLADYLLISQMILQYGCQAEADNPGCVEAVIANIRKRVKEKVVPIDMDQTIQIKSRKLEHSWHIRAVKEFRKKMGIDESKGTIEISFREVVAANATRQFSSLPDGTVDFLAPAPF